VNIKRIFTVIATFVTFMTAITAGAGTAAAEADLPECQTVPWRSQVVQQWNTGSWGYLYRIVWCVERSTITWAVPEIVPVVPDDSECTWEGTSEQDLGPVGNSNSWAGFSMGLFSCPDGDQSVADYPWGIILIHPDGTSEISGQGTA
jgi:hypothetical protein